MTHFTTQTFDVCACCLIALANDDTSGHDYYCSGDPDPLCAFVEYDGTLVPGDDIDGHFSWSECEGCGALAGQRYEIVGLLEHPLHPTTYGTILRTLEDNEV